MIGAKKWRKMKRQRGFILCSILAVALLTACNSNDKKASTENVATSLDDMTMTINGSKLCVYGEAKDFLGDKWRIVYAEDDKKEVGDLEEIYASAALKDDEGQEVRINLKNWKDKSVKLTEAQVSSVSIRRLEKSKLKITLPNKINNDSTVEDIVEAYGQPVSYRAMDFNGEESYHLTYESRGKHVKKERITFEFANDKLSGIQMEAAEKKKKADENTVFSFNDVLGYKSFTSIHDMTVAYSDKLLNGTVTIGNITFKKGQSIGSVLDDGWNIGNTYSNDKSTEMTMVKGNSKLHLTVDGTYKVGEEINRNMEIISLDFSVSKINGDELKLPGGLKTDVGAEEVMEVFGMAHRLKYSEYGLSLDYQKEADDSSRLQTSFNYDTEGRLTDFRMDF